MKFTVSQSSLAQALAIVSKGMGSNASQPIISGVHLIAENGTLELQTTDTTIFIRHSIPANVDEAGETVLSGKILMSIVKNLADAPISVEGDDHNVMIAPASPHSASTPSLPRTSRPSRSMSSRIRSSSTPMCSRRWWTRSTR